MNTLGLGRPVYSFGLGVPYGGTPEPEPPPRGGGAPWRAPKQYKLPDWLYEEDDLIERIQKDDHEVMEIIVAMLTKGIL